jgi:hypothetical protein
VRALRAAVLSLGRVREESFQSRSGRAEDTRARAHTQGLGFSIYIFVQVRWQVAQVLNFEHSYFNFLATRRGIRKSTFRHYDISQGYPSEMSFNP